MRLTVHFSEAEAAAAVAETIAAAAREAPSLVIGLDAGRLLTPVYGALVRLGERGRLDLSSATTFNLEEFLGVPASHPGSLRAHMERHLFAHLGTARPRVYFLDGMAPDAGLECERYERALAAAGGIDLQLLALGPRGQLGFGDPAAALEARTHAVRLAPLTRRANASFFGSRPADVPERALSMGVATILRARRIVLVATGRGRGRAVEQAVTGPLTTRVPASLLQVHRDVDLVLDEAAAERLTARQRLRR